MTYIPLEQVLDLQGNKAKKEILYEVCQGCLADDFCPCG